MEGVDYCNPIRRSPGCWWHWGPITSGTLQNRKEHLQVSIHILYLIKSQIYSTTILYFRAAFESPSKKEERILEEYREQAIVFPKFGERIELRSSGACQLATSNGLACPSEKGKLLPPPRPPQSTFLILHISWSQGHGILRVFASLADAIAATFPDLQFDLKGKQINQPFNLLTLAMQHTQPRGSLQGIGEMRPIVRYSLRNWRESEGLTHWTLKIGISFPSLKCSRKRYTLSINLLLRLLM